MLVRMCQNVKVASIVSRRTGLGEWLGDLSKMTLSGRLPHPLVSALPEEGVMPGMFGSGRARAPGHAES